MSLRDAFIAGAVVGHEDFLEKIATYAGSPDTGSRTADFKGQICYDSTNDDWYINNTNATTWTKINY